MAKKKKASPKAKVKGKKPVAGAAKKPARKPGPRSQALPGMEQRKHQKLDNLCESIGEHRDTMNAAKMNEKSNIQSALQYMTSKQLDVYRHARVELARIPGADKLRVRVTGEEGDAQSGGEAIDAPAPDGDQFDAGDDDAADAERDEDNQAEED